MVAIAGIPVFARGGNGPAKLSRNERQALNFLYVPKEKQMWQRLKKAFFILYPGEGHCLRIETWTQAGVPDCYFMVRGKVVWVELKRMYHKPTPLQQSWHAACTLAGGRAVLLTARPTYVNLRSWVCGSLNDYVEESRYPAKPNWMEIMIDIMALTKHKKMAHPVAELGTFVTNL